MAEGETRQVATFERMSLEEQEQQVRQVAYSWYSEVRPANVPLSMREMRFQLTSLGCHAHMNQSPDYIVCRARSPEKAVGEMDVMKLFER